MVPEMICDRRFVAPPALVIANVGALVSRVKAKAVEATEILPATSICRTCTELTPCVAVNELVHVAPPSVEYCTVAPVSTPESVSAPLLVILSVADDPVSLVSAMVGAVGALVSRVKTKAAEAADVTPQTACLTSTVFTPSLAVNDEDHDRPLSVEYSTVEP